MALQVNLTLSKTYFLPGEVVKVCVQIYNDADSASQEGEQTSQVVHVKELSFQACGSERTDSSFVHRLHRPDVPVGTLDNRKRVRSIFTTESAVLVSNKVLAPHALQSFQLRFRLPAALPPSFRGSAVRFLYLIQVKAVYEVHRGDTEAVVYETVASTSLMVWPSPGSGSAPPLGGPVGPADRRLSALDGGGLGISALLARGQLPSAHKELDRASAGGGNDGISQQVSGARGAGGALAFGPGPAAAPFVSTPLNPPTHGSSPLSATSAGNSVHGGLGAVGGGGLHAGSGEEGEVPMCDYVLGRKCRIRWQEVRPSGPSSALSAGDATTGCGDTPLATVTTVGGVLLGGSTSGALPSSSSFGSVAAPGGPPLRGVIPFGVNRPFMPLFPQHPAAGDSEDSDADEGSRGGEGASAGGPTQGVGAVAGISHVQRQLSSGATGGGVAGIGPFGRQGPSRRGSLFGKVYALNVGDQPLLRVLLQAPLEVPLQPGATFGGVLDFRQALPPAALASEGAQPVISCYDVAVLLESEEVISAECRPTSKRDGSGLPAGAPYVVRRLHSEHHELTCDSALTSFTFSLPATATPCFRTPMVSLRWVLRFELTVGPRLDVAALDKRARSPKPQLDQLVWSLPLIVRAPVAVPR